jgi:hypothetical protein
MRHCFHLIANEVAICLKPLLEVAAELGRRHAAGVAQAAGPI